ncbi:hypothetical protein SNEBB_010541 [Seison nebaliae]|nr:hypothetical protein SNEBB_010541 [Seison nebaliae]
MAGFKFTYDESGNQFFYFLSAIYALVLIPMTYVFWPNKTYKDIENHPEEWCHYLPSIGKRQLLNKDLPQKKRYRKVKILILSISWILLLLLVYKTSTMEIQETVKFDPYAILGLDEGASKSEVKKQYFKLSKVHHPDKGGSEDTFMKISKAMKTLTDDEAKKNWENHGNPDGPGAMLFGIALPAWIIESEYSVFVLGAYGFLFFLLLPIVVGIWWKNSSKYCGEQILLNTMTTYAHYLQKNTCINYRRCLLIFSGAFEFCKQFNSKIQTRPTDDIEVFELIKLLGDVNERTKETPFNAIYSVKARALLIAHIERHELTDNLISDLNVLLKETPQLLIEMIHIVNQLISMANAPMCNGKIIAPHIQTIENIMKLSQTIIQGVNEKKSPLLQLPYMNEAVLKQFHLKKRHVNSLKVFATIHDDDRRRALKSLSNNEYIEMLRALSIFPRLFVNHHVHVSGEDDATVITTGALVTITFELSRSDYSKVISNYVRYSGNHSNYSECSNNIINETRPTTSSSHHHDESRNDSIDIKSNMIGNDGDRANSNTRKTKNPQSNNKQQFVQRRTKRNEKKKKKNAKKVKKILETSSDSDSQSDKEGGTNGTDGGETTEQEFQNEDEKIIDEFQLEQKKKDRLEQKTHKSHRVFCPFYPLVKQEYWWLYIFEKKTNNIMSLPTLITDLVDTKEIEVKLMAPEKAGQYTYIAVLRSDSYLDCDQLVPIKINVVKAEEVELDHPQWHFSEDEDDGALQGLDQIGKSIFNSTPDENEDDFMMESDDEEIDENETELHRRNRNNNNNLEDGTNEDDEEEEKENVSDNDSTSDNQRDMSTNDEENKKEN